MYFTLSEQLVFSQLINEINILKFRNKHLCNALEICKINIESFLPEDIDPWYRDNILATIQAALDAAGGK